MMKKNKLTNVQDLKLKRLMKGKFSIQYLDLENLLKKLMTFSNSKSRSLSV